MVTIPETMTAIIDDLRIKEERDLLRDQMIDLEAALYNADSAVLEKILRSRIPEVLAGKMRNIIDELKFRDHPYAIKSFFQDFNSVLDHMPLLRIGIAFKLTEEMITRLHQWTKDNLGSGILLDINYDRSILGGAKIIFGGKYKEITLTQIITDVFIKEKLAIQKIIRE